MSTPRWLQHPLTVFLLPFIVLVASPYLYKLLPAGTDPSYDEAKLHKIATSMENIYNVLANTTFIPHNAISRGPHQINKTAITCKPSASVLRLMELLPYVDVSLVDTEDWLFGGSFMDYRNPEHLAQFCDPLRGSSFGWNNYMSLDDIALTSWGTGGWNDDRTWVMIYNTEKNAIRIYEGETFVDLHQAQHEFGSEMENFWFQDIGEYGIWYRKDGAPKILQAITNNYLTLKWTPWTTSHRENDFGISQNRLNAFGLDEAHIKDLMKRNGWPRTFDPVRLNADFIRAKHAPHGRTITEVIHANIQSIIDTKAYIEQRISHHRSALSDATTEEERWIHRWRIQRREWDLEDSLVELPSTEEDMAKVCPDGVCETEPAPILWEFWSLSRTYDAAVHTNSTEKCNQRYQWLDEKMQWIYENTESKRFKACLQNEAIKLSYIRQAFEDSKTDALRHCEPTGCNLLPVSDVFARAETLLSMDKRHITNSEARIAKILAIASTVPPEAKNALAEMENAIALLRQEIHGVQSTIDTIEIYVERAKNGGSDLHWVLENFYEVHGMAKQGMGLLAKEAFGSYAKHMRLKRIQSQIESVPGNYGGGDE
jgi:hypothetical protein